MIYERDKKGVFNFMSFWFLDFFDLFTALFLRLFCHLLNRIRPPSAFFAHHAHQVGRSERRIGIVCLYLGGGK